MRRTAHTDEDVFQEARLGGRDVSKPATHGDRLLRVSIGSSKSKKGKVAVTVWK
jgi:hypothetical protein